MIRQLVPAILACAVGGGAALAATIELRFPVDCVVGETCAVQHYVDRDPGGGARDYRCGTLTYDGHSGVDIRLPTEAARRAGVDVLAAAAGTVLRTRDGVADISVRVAGLDSVRNIQCGNAVVIAHTENFETQYCHMAAGSVAVKPGQRVAAGEVLGRIGLSGETEFPHLHITVRQNDRVVDPFAFGAPEGSCGGDAPSLWDAAAQAAMAYRPGVVLNAGFAAGAVTADDIEAATADPPTRADALVAYVRAIGLSAGDVQQLTLTAPDGERLVDRSEPPLDRNKAQYLLFAGRKAPPSGWRPGIYTARYAVVRDGRPVIEETFSIAF